MSDQPTTPRAPGEHTAGRMETSGPELTVDDKHVATCWNNDQIAAYEDEANARRIAALWNAANDANLGTSAIESGVIGELVALARLVDTTQTEFEHVDDSTADDYVKERHFETRGHEIIEAARAALAKIGGQS